MRGNTNSLDVIFVAPTSVCSPSRCIKNNKSRHAQNQPITARLRVDSKPPSINFLTTKCKPKRYEPVQTKYESTHQYDYNTYDVLPMMSSKHTRTSFYSICHCMIHF